MCESLYFININSEKHRHTFLSGLKIYKGRSSSNTVRIEQQTSCSDVGHHAAEALKKSVRCSLQRLSRSIMTQKGLKSVLLIRLEEIYWASERERTDAMSVCLSRLDAFRVCVYVCFLEFTEEGGAVFVLWCLVSALIICLSLMHCDTQHPWNKVRATGTVLV